MSSLLKGWNVLLVGSSVVVLRGKSVAHVYCNDEGEEEEARRVAAVAVRTVLSRLLRDSTVLTLTGLDCFRRQPTPQYLIDLTHAVAVSVGRQLVGLVVPEHVAPRAEHRFPFPDQLAECPFAKPLSRGNRKATYPPELRNPDDIKLGDQILPGAKAHRRKRHVFIDGVYAYLLDERTRLLSVVDLESREKWTDMMRVESYSIRLAVQRVWYGSLTGLSEPLPRSARPPRGQEDNLLAYPLKNAYRLTVQRMEEGEDEGYIYDWSVNYVCVSHIVPRMLRWQKVADVVDEITQEAREARRGAAVVESGMRMVPGMGAHIASMLGPRGNTP